MASTTFDFDIADGAVSESAAVAVGTDGRALLRFETFTGPASARLKIVNNATTTYVNVTDKQAWSADGLMAGSQVSLEATMNSNSGSATKGILETSA